MPPNLRLSRDERKENGKSRKRRRDLDHVENPRVRVKLVEKDSLAAGGLKK